MADNTMTPEVDLDEEFTILVEWADGDDDYELLAGGDIPDQLKEKSEKALALAMKTVKSMAKRVTRTMSEIDSKARPDEAEISFGINLRASAGALLAKTGANAQLNVTLKWTTSNQDTPSTN